VEPTRPPALFATADAQRESGLYKVGDKVVYPHHGAGTVVKREKREVLGEKREYLTIKILHNDMTVNVPADNAERVGLRKVIDGDEIKKVVKYLTSGGTEMPKNWNRRFKHNRDKMKTGDIFELAEVVCNLALRDTDKGLSTGEKQMYVKAKKILASELMYAKHMSEEDAAEWLDGVLAGVEEKPAANGATPKAATKTATPRAATPRAATPKATAAKASSAKVAARPKAAASRVAVASSGSRATASKAAPVAKAAPAKATPRQASAAKTAPARKPVVKQAIAKTSPRKAAPKKPAAAKRPAAKSGAVKSAAKRTVAKPANAKSAAGKQTAQAKKPVAKKKTAAAA